jgi:hypothetical protein
MHANPTSTEPDVGTSAARTAATVFAVVLAVALFATVASIDVPRDASDAELTAWWQDSGNRASGVVAGVAAFLAACSLPAVLSHLASLPAVRESPRWFSFARMMGGAVTAVWLVTGALRASVGHLVDVMDEPLPGPDVLRMVTALNYTLLGFCGMGVLGLCILATSIVLLRTGAMPRWVAYVGLVCSVVMLAAVLAQYGAYTTPLGILWSLCLAVGLRNTRP